MPTSPRSDPVARSLAYDGWTVLVCTPDGSIDGGETGLYHDDARILSRHVLRLDGEPIPRAAPPLEDGRRWSVVLHRRRDGGDAEGPALPQDAWEIDVERLVGPGMQERIELRNHSMVDATAELVLELDADFSDSLLRGRPGGPRWEIRRGPATGAAVEIRGIARHQGAKDERGLRVRVTDGPHPRLEQVASARGRVRLGWDVRVPAGGGWAVTMSFDALTNGTWRGAGDRPERDAMRLAWSARRTRVEAEPTVGQAFDRAAEDLLSLRSWDLEPARDGSAWLPNAGVPWFTGLFGRDVLTAGWQGSMLGPEMNCGALELAAQTQGRRVDDWTEEEPGRIIHEQRRGPLATLGIRPQAGYYGNQTASALFPVALTEAWHWTGDDDLLRRHRSAAWQAIEWAERYGDRDGDGFLEYQSRSTDGLRNQGWKDSDEAIRHPDGTLVDVPIATIEEQAFHYLALQRMAEILIALDEPGDEADRLLRRAEELRSRFDAAFWLPGRSFYAMALDAGKRPVATIASNPLHALAAGIVPVERAKAVADRLLADDLFSGWGIRTLATSHPSYNRFAYHLGSIWPVENATAMLGFRRYGFDDHLERLATTFFDAIAVGRTDRLPEAITGHQRGPGSRPIPYPGGNPVQAWSASAVVQVVQVLLGLYPFAPAGVLSLVRPRLPEWLPSVTVRRLRVGQSTVSLRFERRADGSADHTVLEQEGPLLIVPAPPPNLSTSPNALEWLAQFALEHAPGRLARCLRIAVGLEPSPAEASR